MLTRSVRGAASLVGRVPRWGAAAWNVHPFSDLSKPEISIHFIKHTFPLYYDGLQDVQKTDTDIVDFFEQILASMESEYPTSYHWLQEQGLNKEEILLRFGEWRQTLVSGVQTESPEDIEGYIKDFFVAQNLLSSDDDGKEPTGGPEDGSGEAGDGFDPTAPISGDGGDGIEAATDDAAEETPALPDDIQYNMSPKDLIRELDRFVIGQAAAKRCVAIAWRARWRRAQLEENMRREVMPKNILMVGPTGCGKTEVARRLARLSMSPFVKVEATKFTEVGYVGKDVNTIVEDLVQNSARLVKERKKREMKTQLEKMVEDTILEKLTGKASARDQATFRKQLQQGLLDQMTIEVEMRKEVDMGQFGPQGAGAQQRTFMILGGMPEPQIEKKNMPISEARKVLMEQEEKKAISDKDIAAEAVKLAENDGIVFLDEIDKICGGSSMGRDQKVSQEGVQRDLLPLIEGTTVQVQNFGNVKTDHVLFICSGAFHYSKPSDLMPEFQGRLPVRVELDPLTEDDLYRIMTDVDYNLIDQQVSMLGTEDYELSFDDDAIREIASVAVECNREVENIGARRLVTILEKVMEDINMEATETDDKKMNVTKEYIREHIGDLLKPQDLSKFIL